MSEADLFALCLWREARGEGHVGMLAVAWVIQNRAVRWRDSIQQVILAPNQFTSMSVEQNPPNPGANDPQYADAQQIVAEVMSGAGQDPTNGGCYYANLATATSGWFFDHIVADTVNHPMTAQIGKHTFYK